MGHCSNQTRSPLTRRLPLCSSTQGGRAGAGEEAGERPQNTGSLRSLTPSFPEAPRTFEKPRRDPGGFGWIGFPGEDSHGFLPVWCGQDGGRSSHAGGSLGVTEKAGAERAQVCRDAGNDPLRNELGERAKSTYILRPTGIRESPDPCCISIPFLLAII